MIDSEPPYPHSDQDALRRPYLGIQSWCALRSRDIKHLFDRRGFTKMTDRLRKPGHDFDGRFPLSVFEFWVLITTWAEEQKLFRSFSELANWRNGL